MLKITESKAGRSALTTLKSVLAAFIGVQSDKNRAEDFAQGKLSHFVIAGVVATILFILVLVGIVALVMPN